MKPRVLQTMKILAVGLSATAAAACQRTPTADPQSTTSTSASASASAKTVVLEAPPDRPMSEDPKLLGLREELLATARQDAAALDVAHFRPLCDKDGYPLVGNVMRKTVGTTEPQPSALCARVRQEKPK